MARRKSTMEDMHKLMSKYYGLDFATNKAVRKDPAAKGKPVTTLALELLDEVPDDLMRYGAMASTATSRLSYGIAEDKFDRAFDEWWDGISWDQDACEVWEQMSHKLDKRSVPFRFAFPRWMLGDE